VGFSGTTTICIRGVLAYGCFNVSTEHLCKGCIPQLFKTFRQTLKDYDLKETSKNVSDNFVDFKFLPL
jgi:hypothetical protein